ncbi:MAG: carboxylating nicotinate-nucleotide diphosphorylase [Anaerolineae bacterium]|nr:carboxylating nicotinate-nucleotide diphosphorylase [Anaerolineae bacterium]
MFTDALPLIDRALSEDIASGDITTRAIVPERVEGQAVIFAKADGIIAGLPVMKQVFYRVDPRIELEAHVQDGESVTGGDIVVVLSGPLSGIITGERVGLNFLCQLSGIATLTARFVDAISAYKAIILDTRKTTPAWRALEKYAVRVGGGRNHRLGLYDMVLVKDNHLAIAGSIAEAVRRVRAAHVGVPIEVEVKTLSELEEVLPLHVDRILLDNMDIPTLKEAVCLAGGKVPLEASGGITLDNVTAVAATGVDYISVGALTHSAPALDFSLEVLQ